MSIQRDISYIKSFLIMLGIVSLILGTAFTIWVSTYENRNNSIENQSSIQGR